ncbi:hypothetical protein AB1285_27160 [Microbacterium sp. NRRL B-14842]|uniref:hypothetical protein n=1 Tax=Microbacterium sp. NRRL B-14842 TaxID=3162881 RepID=UPI003D2A9471
MTTATLALCIIVAVAGAILVILGAAHKPSTSGLPTRSALRGRRHATSPARSRSSSSAAPRSVWCSR